MKKEEIFYKKGYRVTEGGEVIGLKRDRLKLSCDMSGYKRISCRDGDKIINVSVHRLQAFQKYGDLLFYKGVEVRHLNGNKDDNSWGNISIGTHSMNMMDIPEQIRMSKSLYAASFRRKYNKQEVINFYKNNGKSYKKTMNEFNITSKGTLFYILNK